MGAGLFLTNFLLDTNAQMVVWLLIGLLLYARMKHMGTLLPGMVLQTLAAGMLVPVMPSFVSQQMGLAYSQYSLLLLVGGTCAVLGLIPMGRLSDQLGQKWFLIGGWLGDFFSWRVTLLASAGLMAAIALFYSIYPLEALMRKSHSMSYRR